MPTTKPKANSLAATLTDGTGVSKLDGTKIIKDALLDALLSLPGALLVINVASLEAAILAPVTVAFAISDAVIRVAYRAAVKYLQS